MAYDYEGLTAQYISKMFPPVDCTWDDLYSEIYYAWRSYYKYKEDTEIVGLPVIEASKFIRDFLETK